ncbi:sphingomyelin phosphodiesterase 1 isoform X1 [Megachile rotundata]|uniref:sphingomyelin phosphodiesterase 1 isoform X1 n=2 Tax=Megachile rotundata TaxID=143995 RepID=UPI003FD41785
MRVGDNTAMMWFKYFIFCALIFAVHGVSLQLDDINATAFANEIKTWVKEQRETHTFRQMINRLRIPPELQNCDWKFYKGEKAKSICTICEGIFKTFINFRRQGKSDEFIENSVINLCTLLNIQTKRVCEGAVRLNMPIILHIVDSRENLTANTICGTILESKSCPLKDPEFKWNITLSNDAATIIPDNETEEKMKIVQITDIHYDPLYEPNGNANCKEPVCCRKGQNTTGTTSLAGYWGDYQSCDTPFHAVIDALTQINDTHKDIDAIYFTGDIIDHGIWETSKEGNIESLMQIYDKIKDTFKNIPVYPIFGNHEPQPVNQFAPTYVTEDHLTTNWLYKLLADLWINTYNWLPESTRSTILQGGYYTFSPKKGFRIIVLNNNICYSYNWWLWYDPQYPANQLQWLADTLLNAEKNGEFVHILSHMPVSSKSCIKTWRDEYLRIINRFSHLIKAEFNGHTHNDELVLLPSSDTTNGYIAWNGGSITTYTKLNPNYKVYTVASSNYEVTDYDNWMYNLNLANKNSHERPNWYKSYSFKEEYGVSDLSAKSLSNWFNTAVKNETLVNKYYKHFYKQAPPSLEADCNLNCKKQRFCQMALTTENACNNI